MRMQTWVLVCLSAAFAFWWGWGCGARVGYMGEDAFVWVDGEVDGGGGEPCEDVEVRWAWILYSDGDVNVSDVVISPDQSLLLAGSFEQTADFGDGPVEAHDYFDLFVAEYDLNGVHRWSFTTGHMGLEEVVGVAVSSIDQSLLLAGSFSTSIDLGAGPTDAVDGYDTFVASLDADRALLWQQTLGLDDWDIAKGIAVSAQGDVYVVGSFEGGIDLGEGPVYSEGMSDVFVVSYDAGGGLRWARTFGDEGSDLPSGVGVDGLGNVVVTGWFSRTIDFGGGALTAVGSDDVFVVSLDPDGAYRWADAFGGPTYDRPENLEVDVDGNVYVIGYFEGTVDLGSGPVTSDDVDFFLVSYDPDGGHRWSRGLGGAGWDRGMDVATDPRFGAVFITGVFNQAVDFGAGLVSGTADANTFVASFDGGSGAYRWAHAWGTGGVNVGSSRIDVDSGGNVYITGRLDGTVDFGGGPVTSEGSADVFVLCLGCP